MCDRVVNNQKKMPFHDARSQVLLYSIEIRDVMGENEGPAPGGGESGEVVVRCGRSAEGVS